MTRQIGTLVGAVVAAVMASLCCIGPILFGVIGISSVGFAAALEPYRPYFTGLTLLLLAAGWYLTLRKPSTSVSPAASEGILAEGGSGASPSCCEGASARHARIVVLAAVTVLALAMLAFPWVAASLTANNGLSPADAPVRAATPHHPTVTLRIEGMT